MINKEKGHQLRWKIRKTISSEGTSNQRSLAGQRLVTNNIKGKNNLYVLNKKLEKAKILVAKRFLNILLSIWHHHVLPVCACA